MYRMPNGQEMNATVLASLISQNQSYHNAAILEYENYKGENLPIASRVFTDTTKVNNKIASGFRKEIVDQSTGFLFGRPVNYLLEESVSDTDKKIFAQFLRRNAFPVLDLETGKRSAINGTCARLVYIDKQGLEKAIYCPAEQVIFVYDSSYSYVQYAIRYYTQEDALINASGVITNAEVYDATNVMFYNNKSGSYDLTGSMPHGFDIIPLVEFANNEERQSDFAQVVTQITDYDIVTSDVSNEIAEFRNAYMLFKNCTMNAEARAAARLTGGIDVPQDGDVSFLTKQINPEFVKNHKDDQRDDIYRFSSSVDMTSELFTGSGASGETRKWLLAALETKVAMKEMKFKQSSDNMFRVLATLWKKKGINIDETMITYQIDRTYPQELGLEADIQNKLKGVVSDKTRLSVLSIVPDVEQEIKRIDEEQSERQIKGVEEGESDVNADDND